MSSYTIFVFGLIVASSLSLIHAEEENSSTPAVKFTPSNGQSSSNHNLNSGVNLSKRNVALPKILNYFNNALLAHRRRPCINLGDEGCVNGYIPGAGSDGGYLNGGQNPGK